MEEWGKLDPVPALDYLLRDPVPAPAVCNTIISDWANRDAPAASEWIAALPAGPNRDGAIQGLLGYLTNDYYQPDYPAALAWSLALTDPAERLKAAEAIFLQPRSPADTAELRATLTQTTALPETARLALLAKLPP